MFNKFDSDQSETLEIGEIYEMFKACGFYFSKEDVNRIFSIVDEDGS